MPNDQAIFERIAELRVVPVIALRGGLLSLTISPVAAGTRSASGARPSRSTTTFDPVVHRNMFYINVLR